MNVDPVRSRRGAIKQRRGQMRDRSEYSQARSQTLATGFFAAIFLLTLFVGAGTPTFSAEPPPAGKGTPNAMDKPGEKEPCKDDGGRPVACVPVDVAILPFPGCTSGQRCDLNTTGKSCGMLMAGTKCQTVNNGSGVCSCQCVK
jgi:hypothetical protein